MKLKLAGLVVLSFLLNFCIHQPKPKLVIVLVADQMRPDHFSRFRDLYKGGLQWLSDNGISFENAFHQHGYTATGPGHFAIGSGRYPGPSGVLGNSYYDRELSRVVNCVEDPNAKPIGGAGIGRSYYRYSSKTIGDILKNHNPSSKVVSIAGKDRSAIMLAGQNPDLVLYYNNLDRFITSSFYADSLPSYIHFFNSKLNLQNYRDSLWTKILNDSLYIKYSREDNFSGEVDWYKVEHDIINDIEHEKNDYNPTFPISFDRDHDPGKELMGTPWFDEVMIDLCKLIIDEEDLGIDENPDILFIGFSAMDYIIHNYGPFSQEVMDYFLRLDMQLDHFLNHIDNKVGLDNVEFVLTSDHGGLPLPEFLSKLNMSGGRINQGHLNEAFSWIEDEISEQFENNLYFRDWSNFYFFHDKLKKKEYLAKDLEKIIKKYLTMVEGVSKVITKNEILNSTEDDQVSIRLKNMIHPDKSADVFVLLKPGYLYRNPHGTSHGSPYNYDAHVPILFSKKDRAKNQNMGYTETVDIAPTILNLLNIKTNHNFDGKVLPLQ